MIDILTIKYWNKIEIMNEQDVISYEDGRWPDKNLPFSFPEFNRDKFNFIESPTKKYIVFFALKLGMGFNKEDIENDRLWKEIVEDLKNDKCKIIFYSPDWDSSDLVEDLGVPNAYVVSGEHGDNDGPHYSGTICCLLPFYFHLTSILVREVTASAAPESRVCHMYLAILM